MPPITSSSTVTTLAPHMATRRHENSVLNVSQWNVQQRFMFDSIRGARFQWTAKATKFTYDQEGSYISQINNFYEWIRYCYIQFKSDNWSKRRFLYASERYRNLECYKQPTLRASTIR